MSIRKGKKAIRMIANDYFNNPNITKAYNIHSKSFWAIIEYTMKANSK